MHRPLPQEVTSILMLERFHLCTKGSWTHTPVVTLTYFSHQLSVPLCQLNETSLALNVSGAM